jgi:PTS system nitrogen regulatory IIA component
MATDLSTLLQGGVIIPLQDVSSRKQAIHVLCEALSDATGIGARAIGGCRDGTRTARLDRRRRRRCHSARAPAWPGKAVGGFMRLLHGVDFEAIDERPCD